MARESRPVGSKAGHDVVCGRPVCDTFSGISLIGLSAFDLAGEQIGSGGEVRPIPTLVFESLERDGIGERSWMITASSTHPCLQARS